MADDWHDELLAELAKPDVAYRGGDSPSAGPPPKIPSATVKRRTRRKKAS